MKTTKATMTLTNRDLLDQFVEALLHTVRDVHAICEAVTPDRVAPLSEQANDAAKAWGTKLLGLRETLPALANALNPPTAPKPARPHLRLV